MGRDSLVERSADDRFMRKKGWNVQRFFESVGLSLVWAALGVILLFVATLAFDALHPMRIRQMIEEGNIAAGILLGALTIGIAIIIAQAIS